MDSNIKYVLILLLVFAPDIFASRPVRNWQTPKTASLGGAGVALPTAIEGLYLNPALFSFFTESIFSFQSLSGKIAPVNDSRESVFNDAKSPRGFSASVTDGSNQSKGGFSYTDQEESGVKRKKFSFGASDMIDANTSIGFGYSLAKDEIKETTSSTRSTQSHIFSMGLAQIINPNLSWAVVWYDPAWADRINSKTTWGINFKPINELTLLADLGSDLKRSFNKTYSYSLAVEYQALKDVYLRYGTFVDKLFNTEGSGFGIGWIGPKIGLEFSQKRTVRKNALATYLLESEKLKETELSFLYLF